MHNFRLCLFSERKNSTDAAERERESVCEREGEREPGWSIMSQQNANTIETQARQKK